MNKRAILTEVHFIDRCAGVGLYILLSHVEII